MLPEKLVRQSFLRYRFAMIWRMEWRRDHNARTTTVNNAVRWLIILLMRQRGSLA